MATTTGGPGNRRGSVGTVVLVVLVLLVELVVAVVVVVGLVVEVVVVLVVVVVVGHRRDGIVPTVLGGHKTGTVAAEGTDANVRMLTPTAAPTAAMLKVRLVVIRR